MFAMFFENIGLVLDLISGIRDKSQVVERHLRLKTSMVKITGNTFAKLASLGLIREEAVVAA